jgi:hypothetical protein
MSYTPIGVGLAVVILLLLAGLINHQERAEGADGRAAQHAQSTPQRVTQEGLAPVGGIQAPPPEPNPKREEWRSERDLEAQQEMARWALLMMIASFLSVGVTAVGVVFVKQTLDATRAAVNEAENATAAARNTINVTQDLGRRQLRAYIDIKNGAFRVGPAGKGRLRVRVEFANFGQTPARDVRFWVRINWFKPGEFTFTEPDNPGMERGIISPGNIAVWYDGINVDDDDLAAKAINAGAMVAMTWGRVTYRDIFDDRDHHFEFAAKNGTHTSITEGKEAGQHTWGLLPAGEGYKST